MLTEIGPVEIEVPRDTSSSFEPQIAKKRKRRLAGIDEIVSLTAKGLTTGEVVGSQQDGAIRVVHDLMHEEIARLVGGSCMRGREGVDRFLQPRLDPARRQERADPGLRTAHPARATKA